MAEIEKRMGSPVAFRVRNTRYRQIYLFLLIVCVAILLVACAGEEADDVSPQEVETPSQVLSTVEPTVAPTESPAAGDAEESEATAEAAPAEATEEPTPTDEPTAVADSSVLTVAPEQQTFNPSNEDYYISASYAIAAENSESVAEGRKRIVVTASLGSSSYATTMVEEGTLVLVSKQGDLYRPETSSEEYQPYLVGSQISSGESVYGFVVFNLPEEIEEGILEWCPEESYPCSDPLQATVSGIP